jgi:hypothetical protein
MEDNQETTTVTSPRFASHSSTGVLVIRLSRTPQRDVNSLTIELFQRLDVLRKTRAVDARAFALRDSDKINNLPISASIRLLSRFNVIRTIHFHKEGLVNENLLCDSVAHRSNINIQKSPFLEVIKTKVVEIADKVCDTPVLRERLEYAVSVSNRFSSREINQDELQTLMVLLIDAGVRIGMTCSFCRLVNSIRHSERKE